MNADVLTIDTLAVVRPLLLDCELSEQLRDRIAARFAKAMRRQLVHALNKASGR